MSDERTGAREPFDREELARLLPSPGDPELPEDRRLVLEEFLMREIQRDPETPEHQAAPSARAARAARGRRRLALVAAPVAVAALAVGGVLVSQPADDSGGKPGEAGQSSAQALPTVAQLVERASLAAGEEELPVPEEDQFIYVKSLSDYRGPDTEPTVTESWDSLDGRDGWQLSAEHPGGVSLRDAVEFLDSAAPGSYQYLQNLPRDPVALLDAMYELNGDGSKSPDGGAFTMIGDMIRGQLVPSDLAPSFYQAAALIPGVTVVGDATDALGREGIALALVNEAGTHREEWVFDEETYAFLGLRRVYLPTGEVEATDAIIELAVVDEMGQRPGDGSGDANA